MKLILVRHGETEENKRDILQGHMGGHLTKKGISQAKKVAKRLAKEQFNAIYCSNLRRAKQTCKEIIKYHPRTKVIYTKELREQKLGRFQGKSHTILDGYLQKKKISYAQLRAKDIESVEELHMRAVNFFRKTAKKHTDETVLWVTHGGIIIPVLLHVFKLTNDHYKLAIPHNTAVSIIELDTEGNYQAPLINCVAHL